MHLGGGTARALLGVEQRPLGFVRMSEYHDPDVARGVALPLILEAGSPYFDWLLGGRERASAALAELLSRSSSEIAESRIRLAVEDGDPVGTFVALPGELVLRCRHADTVALLKHADDDGARPAVLERLAATRDLFPVVHPHDFYLSKIGVVVGRRRRGLGRELMEEVLAEGRSEGFGGFHLHVNAANYPAVHLYRSLGFYVESERRAAGMHYFSMRLSLPRARRGYARTTAGERALWR